MSENLLVILDLGGFKPLTTPRMAFSPSLIGFSSSLHLGITIRVKPLSSLGKSLPSIGCILHKRLNLSIHVGKSLLFSGYASEG
jgi:hypothetical protein